MKKSSRLSTLRFTVTRSTVFSVPRLVCGSINAELQVNYLGEGKLHDELLIELAIRELGAKSFRVHYQVRCGERPIALAEVGVVCFDYLAKKATGLPEVFLQKITEANQS